MPLDSVELSACPRVGVWLSSTLSSSRCLDPALGNVALLNSTVFVLWIKLQHTQERVKDRVFLLNRNQKNITCRNRYKADPTSGNFCFMLQSSFYKVYQARNKGSKAVKQKGMRYRLKSDLWPEWTVLLIRCQTKHWKYMALNINNMVHEHAFGLFYFRSWPFWLTNKIIQF